MTFITDLPLAEKGYTSYRYRGSFGWIMIGAKDDADALNQASRSLCNPRDLPPTRDRLEVWNGVRYTAVNAS
jgi:hypothetical protein